MPEGRLSASDDVISTLSERVNELSKRVALLQAELDSAQGRLAVYEDYDATLQQALSGALRAAHEVRSRAETTAAQILEQAREERRILLKEIERLRDERDQLQEEIAERRRGAIAPLAPARGIADSGVGELRSVATEALRGIFQELVDDLRQAQPGARPTTAPPPMAPPLPAASVEPAPVAHAAAAPPMAPPPPPPATAARPTPSAPTLAPPPAEALPRFALHEVPRPIPEPAISPERASAALEDLEIAPTRVEPAVPTTDIQLVLSPVASFPRLVDIERRIQSLPAIRTLYVRDFRGGVATLAVALRSPMTPEAFVSALSGLSQPRLRLVSGNRNVVELRVEGEASIA